jgi:hypothetical protein
LLVVDEEDSGGACAHWSPGPLKGRLPAPATALGRDRKIVG